MRIRVKVQPDGSLVDRSGANCGKILGLTLDLDLDSLQVVGGDRGGAVLSLDSERGGPSTGVTEERHQAVDVGSTNAVVAREERLDGTDNRRELIDAYARIFGKRPTYSPARMKAAERAFAEEPDLDTLILAVRGAKVHYERKGGRPPDFTDVFGTFRGTSDLSSRINWLAGLASDSHDPFSTVPSGAREMVLQHRHQVEAWLLDPGNDSRRSRGENSADFLAQMGFQPTVADGRVTWVRTRVGP